MQERRHEPEADQDDAGHRRKEAGEVAPRQFVDGDVRDVRPAVEDGDDPEEQRRARPQTRPKPRERPRTRECCPEREDCRGRVLIERDAGLAVDECVVERVQEGDPRRAPEDEGLGPHSYWSASSTFSLDARRAGRIAASTPAAIATTTKTASVK